MPTDSNVTKLPPRIVVRSTPAGGFGLWVNGSEVFYITPEQARVDRTREGIIGDWARRVSEARRKGAISAHEAGQIIAMVLKIV